MIGRALNSKNDIFLDNGSFAVVRDGPEIVQHVRTRLLFYLEEWFLDKNAGTPYFQEIFRKPANIANAESRIKERILGTPGVLRLLNFTMDYQGANQRRLSVSFSAETTAGTIDNTKVTING